MNGSSGVGEMLEYPHGGKTAITTLSDPQTPAACAVDPTTGNLAVANSDGNGPYYGELAIYGDGQGQPTLYWCTRLRVTFMAQRTTIREMYSL